MKSEILRKVRLFKPLLLLVCLFASINTVQADGTREMYAGIDGGKSRAGILAGEYKRTPAGMPFKNFATMKVYAKEGEHIYLASSIFRRDETNRGTTKITWKAPDGSKGEFTKDQTNGYTVGYIRDRAAELGGPSLAGVNDGDNGGYKPFSLTVGKGQTGVWEIEFVIVPNNPRNANDEGTWSWKNKVGTFSEIGFEDDGIEVSDGWHQGYILSQYPYMMAFDISVANAGETALIPGRTYTNVMSVMLPVRNGEWGYPWDAKFYVLTNEGYLYDIRTGGINPGTGTLFANNRGIVKNGTTEPMGENISGYVDAVNRSYTVGGESSYRSVDFYNTTEIIPTYNPNLQDNYTTDTAGKRTYIDVTHKMFFSKPSKDLPKMALAVYGNVIDSTWLRNTSATDNPELSNLQFVGKENGVPNVFGPEGVNIAFDANSVFDYELLMTFPGTSYKERTFKGSSHEGTNIVEWDGLDGNGVKVNNVKVAVSGKIKTGEVHFPWFDLEYNPNGFKLVRLKSDWETRTDSSMCWNDNGTQQCSDGKTGGHSFAQGFGDNKILDTWTYTTADVANTIIDEAARQFIDLEVVSIEADKTEISDLNDDITFTMKVRNNLHESYIFKGDNVKVNANAVGASIGIPGFDIVDISSSDPLCTIVSQPTADTKGLGYINLANGHEATITVKGKVSSAGISGHSIIAGGYIMRPGDIFEIDANNIDNDGKPLDPVKEYEGQSHNNFKTVEISVGNQAPTATADAEEVGMGATLEKNVLDNDTDYNGDHLSLVDYTVNGVKYTTFGIDIEVKDGDETLGTLNMKANGDYTFSAGTTLGAVPTIKYTVTDDYTTPLTAESTLDISVVNANCVPTITPATESLIVIHATGNYKPRYAYVPIIFADADLEGVTVTLSGTDAGKFTLENGCIYFTDGGLSSGGNAIYSITVSATDGIISTPVQATYNVRVYADAWNDPRLIPLSLTLKAESFVYGTTLGDRVANLIASKTASDPWNYSPLYNGTWDFTVVNTSTGVVYSCESNRVLPVGSYKLVANYTDNAQSSDKNYASNTITANFTITPKPVDITWQEPFSFEYNGKEQTVPVKVNAEDLVSRSVCDGKTATDVVKVIATDNVKTDADEYTATATGLSNPNYVIKDAAQKTQDWEITAATPTATITGPTGSYVYNGNPQEPAKDAFTVVVGGSTLDPEEYTITYTNNVNAGENTAVATISPVTPGAFEPATVNFTIEKATISIDITSPDKTYNGDDVAPLNATFGNIATDDKGKVTVAISGRYEDKNVGNNKPVEVTYTLSGEASNNYQLPTTKPTVTGNVTPATITPTASVSGKTYDGTTDATVTVSGFSGLVDAEDEITVTATGDFSDKNVGDDKDVTVTYTLGGADMGNYELASPTETMTANITAKEVTLGWGTTSFTYDGTEKTVTATVTNPVDGDDVNVTTYTGNKETVVGDNYTATATGLDNSNYKLPTNASTNWEITPATGTITVAPIAAETYNGEAHTPAPVVTIGGKTLVEGTDYTVTYTNNTDAGTATVTINPVPGSGYSFDATNKTFTIDPAVITINSATVDAKDYDGEADATVTVDPKTNTTGIIAADLSKITITAVDPSFDNKNAGNDKPVTVDSYTLSGAAAGNYTLSPSTPSLKGTISPIELTPSATVDDKVYNGLTDATITAGTPAGILSGDKVTLTATGSFADKNVEDNKAITVNYELTGDDKDNYTLSASSSTEHANITPKEVTLTWSETTFTYDGNKKVVTATVGGTANSEVVTVTSYSNNEKIAVSNYTAVANTLSDANYKLPTNASVDWKIVAATGTITVEPIADVTYNSTAQKPSPVVKLGTTTLVEGTDYTVEYANNTNVGTATATIKPLGGYAFENETVNFTIKKAPITITGSASDKVYDGSTSAAVSIEYSGIYVDDKPNLTVSISNANFADKNVGTNKVVTADYALGGSAANNYEITSTPELKANITAATITVTAATASNKEYDSETDATVTVTAFSGKKGADNVGIIATGTFEDANAGTAKTVNAEYTLTGDDKDNYVLASATGSTTADITPKPVSLDWGTTSFTYDGTEKTVTATVTNPEGTDVVKVTTYTGNKETNVGDDYTATATGLNNSNYKLPTNASTKWEITPATGTISVAPIAAETYNGEAHTPAPVVTMGGKTLVEGTDYTVTYTNNTNAGTATATITPKEGSNYSFTATPATFTINKATISATVEVSDKPYDGERDAEVTIKTTTGKIGTEDVAISATGLFDTKDAGDDKVVTVTYTLTGTAKDNYELATATSTEKADITPKVVTLNWGETSFIYDGNPKTVTATVEGVVGSDIVTVTGYTGNEETLVHNYIATATGLNNSNYQLPADPSTGWSIASSAVTVSVEIPTATRTYNGEEHKPVPTVKIGDVTLTEDVDYVVVYSNNVNAGEATVSVKPASENYVFSQVNKTFTITPATITVTEATVTPKVYDSNVNAEVTVNTISGNVGADDVTVTATGIFDNKNVGDDKDVTVTYTLSGADKGNYKLATEAETKSGNITPKTITVAKSTAENKVYDATDDATVSIAESDVTGKIGDEDVTVSATGSFANANVGDDKNVDVTYALSGADKANYELASTSATTTANISPKEVTLTWGTSVFTYDGTAKTITATVEGAEGDDAVTVTTYTDNKNTEAGNYTATATALSNSNYKLPAEASKDWEIKPATGDVIITLPTEVYTYDGNDKEPTPVVKIGDKTLDEGTDYTVSYDNNKDAGTAKVIITPVPGSGYSFETADEDFTINKAVITINDATVAPKTYNGNATATVTVDPATNTTGIVAGEEAKITITATNPTFDDKNVGEDKPITVEKYVLSGEAAKNYTISTTTPSLTGDVTPATITVENISAENRTYNSTTDATVTVNTISGKIGEDDITVSATGSFANANVGDDKNVDVTYSLSGADKANYQLSSATGSTTANISPKEVTLTWGTSVFTYDGTEKTITATVEGAQGDDVVTVTTYTDNKKTEAGNYTATATALNNSNYKLPAEASKDWKIKPATGEVTVTLPTDAYTYDGNDKEPTPIVKIGDKTLVEGTDYTVEYKDNVNAGEATVTIKPVDGSDYSFEATDKKFDIEPATITVTDLTVADKEYDGDTDADVTINTTTGIVAGDKVTVSATGTFDNKNAGEDKDVTVTYTLSGADKDNYKMAEPTATEKADITPKEITLAWGTSVFTYDSTEKTITATVEGAEGDDVVTVTTYTDNAKTNAGNYTATATALSNSNYKLPAEASKDWKIKPATGEVTVTLPTETLTYNGEAQTPTPVVKVGDKTLVEGTDYTVEYKDNVNAGEATVTIKPVDGSDYSFDATDKKFDIEPATITVTDLTVADKEYDGDTDADVTINTTTGIVAGDKVTVSATGTFDNKNAGEDKDVTVTYTLSGADKDNYKLAEPTATEKADITAKEITLEWSDADFTYDGTEKVITATVEGAVEGDDVTVATYTDNKKTEVGEYKAIATELSDNNYKLPAETSKDWKINPATGEITVTLPTETLTYNGEAQTPTPVVKVGDKTLVEGTDYTVEYKDNVNAGEATVTIKPVDGSDYSFEATDKKFDIEPATITVTDLTVADKDYDGDTDADVTINTTTGIVAGDKVTVSATGTFDNKNAGEDKDVTVTYTLSGADKDNYKLAEPTATEKADITPKEITLAWGTSEFTYDGTEKTITATVEGAEGDDVVTVTAYTDNAKTNADNYTATATALSDNNYKLPAEASKDWKIKPATGEVTVTLPSETLTYNGEAQTPTPVVKVGDKTLVEGTDYTVEYKDNVNAGEATVTIKPVDGSDYSFEATDKKFDIEPKEITLAWGTSEFTYDGTEKTITATVEGAVEGDDVTVTTYTDNKKTEAGEYKATAIELSDSNYKLPADASKDWTIKPAGAVTITLPADALTYNGEAQTPAPVVKVGDKTLVEGTDYTVEYIDNVNAGEATVTIKPVDGGNYSFEPTDKKFDIEPKEITLAWGTSEFTYDGTEKTITATVEGAVEGDDVTVITYTDNKKTDAGEYKATATELSDSNYKLPADASKDWTIKPAGAVTITLPADALTYNGEAQTPAPVVKVGDKTLVEGTDYTVEYKDNVNAGEATVTIKPVDGGNYSFEPTDKKFDIEPKEVTLTWSETYFKYDGTEKNVEATVNGAVKGDDVKVSTYTENKKTEEGTYKAIATALNNKNYKLPKDASVEWTIAPIDYYNVTILDGEETLKVVKVKDGETITDKNIGFVPTKEGYDFVGWDKLLPITINGKDEVLNVSFVAKKYTISGLEMNGTGFCPESENIIRYTAVGDGAPVEYSITFDEKAIEAGFENVEFTMIQTVGELPLYIPYCDAGKYTAKVQFRNIDNSVSEKFDIVMNVYLSTRYMVDIWTDVVSAVNVENRFLEYQWYHNDEKLEGATMPYYCERDGLTGYYFMEVLTVDNRRLRTCPKFFGDTKENISLMVYPNPTSDYAVVELSFDNGEEHKLTVVNELGVLMFETTFTGVKRDINMSSYPTGAYVVNVDGLTVKEIKR